MDPRKALVTFESVAAAAESLTNAGQRPSVRAVITVLGGGSPNAVLPHLQAWKAARPSVKAADVALDPRIVTILAEQITSAVIDATRTAEARAADLEADAEAVAEAGRLAEARAEELAADLAQVQGDNQQQAGRLDALVHEIDQVKKEAGAAIADARAEALRERDAAELVRQVLARAELRLEAVPAMEVKLVELRAQLDAEHTTRTNAEKAAAVAQAELVHVHADNQQQARRLEALANDLDQVKKEAGAAVAEARAAEKDAAVARAEQQAAERRAEDIKEELHHARDEVRNYQLQTERDTGLMAKLREELTQVQQLAATAREEAAILRGQTMQGKTGEQPTSANKAAKPTRAKKAE